MEGLRDGRGRNKPEEGLSEVERLKAEKSGAIHDKHPDMGYRRIRDTLAHDHGINVNDKRILSRSISANALSEVA